MQKKLLLYTKMNFGVAANGGIKKKVFAQAKAFRALGFVVDVLYFEHNVVKIEGDSTQISQETTSKIGFLQYIFGGYLKSIDLASYDYIYIRHFLTNFLFLRMLAKIKAQKPSIKIFMEIPTFPYRFEFGTMPLKKRIELWIDERCTPYFKRYICRIVTFSSQPVIFGIPTIKTDNGIDIEQFGLLPKAPFNGKTLHLLGLANVQRWHGFDRFLPQLNSKFHLHIVGIGDEIPHLQALVQKYDINEFVTFHGFLSGPQLDTMFRQCHLGIGSCGMHRINVAKGETSALKSREYAARGLPFVIGYDDRGFPENYPFLLQIPADESPINMEKLADFYSTVTQTDDYNLQMHDYAKQHLTWRAKLQNVATEFLK